MSLLFVSDPVKVIEAGRLLQEERNRKGLSIEEICKLLGMRPNQIQAIEEGDIEFFKRSTQTLLWHARLYAKKIGVDLSELLFNGIRRHSTPPSFPTQNIPAFLLKSPSKSETEVREYERR